MTQKEFEERTGLNVESLFFNMVINEDYMKDETPKDEYCASWKEDNKMTQAKLEGIQNVVRSALGILKGRELSVREGIEELRVERNSLLDENRRLQERISELEVMCENKDSRISEMEEVNMEMRWDMIRMKVHYSDLLNEGEKEMVMSKIR